MTRLSRLKVTDVRNIRSATLSQFAQTNIIYGANGSGKTTLLECIHLLGLGRSFRGMQMKPIIYNDAKQCAVFGELINRLANQTIGVAKNTKSETKVKLDGEFIKSLAPLADLLPLQLISADTHLLLSGSPKIRRQFIDWGLFHVEQEFLQCWRRHQQALKQRNSLLRQGRIHAAEITPWEQQLAQSCEQIDSMRKSYVESLKNVFKSVFSSLYDGHEQVVLQYNSGWDDSLNYADYLVSHRDKDAARGFTQAGAHRADLKIKMGNLAAADVLSRGQQKLLVAALRIAQGKLLQQQTGKASVYLVDDLPAELDKAHRERFINNLYATQSQVFITAVEAEDLKLAYSDKEKPAMFHVEHGVVTSG